MNSPTEKLLALDLAKHLKRSPEEHKGNAGKAILIGGAPGMAGALLLAGKACLHLGAGWTILEMLDPASAHAAEDSPELMIQLADSESAKTLAHHHPDLIAIGPGLGQSTQGTEWLKTSLAYPELPLVLSLIHI